jgi:hypothetical protein
MRSLLVEFHRFGSLETGIWRAGDRYLAAVSEHPVREVAMPIDQLDFQDLMRDLRYEGSAEGRLEALKKAGDIAALFLGDDSLGEMRAGDFPVQLDLVVNPAELAALPFEATADEAGRPLFARDERAVIVTRRVRHEFAEERAPWPARPRVLYGWAAPPGVSDVPFQEHESALRAALEPWIGPDDERALTVLPELTLAALADACRAAAGASSCTHVHLLAHGYPVGHGHRQRFGVALHGEGGDLEEVTPEQIEAALAPLAGRPVVVTLAVCDAANLTNSISPQRSIAHSLHVAGFPIVVASQLPLTKAGSGVLVEKFYGALLAGRDVRLALHATRVALYESRNQTGHDWASLVGYARLPEGYADHLLALRLEAVLAALKTLQARSDRLLAGALRTPEDFDAVAGALQARIAALAGFVAESEQAGRKGVLEENLGLLGSAEKRLAELHFVRGTLGDGERWRQAMRADLERARDWYRKGSERNLSHHWTAVQCLCLEAALGGRIPDAGLWHAAVMAARIDRRGGRATDAIWALGSLLELHLLAPLAGLPSQVGEARAAWAEMRAAVAVLERPDPFPIESTRRQLRRYVEWWTTANGFFPGAPDLAAEAAALLAQ